ncbi:MgtC/SapB family protein [Pelosinus sp. IPA-1]|uniref:MgtC/SapB family protein n=1 Tax=Pelosinus sp. IPA-1 TaxID=3029569 RepID=UPI00243615D9|nr:MgtC/SapB family protein [Pelosinus sp. IPA-1]GMA98597.1 membrane protein [Pelosinus sp. IPA-1]
MDVIDFSLRLSAALVFGAAIGFERQRRQRMAGIRTNALVCVGAAMFVMLGLLTPNEASPTRIAAQVVTGIGFLGAGVIMRDGLNVRGMNTAATMWCVAAVGTLTGMGFILHAGVGMIVILIANVLLRPLARIINDKPMLMEDTEIRYFFRAVCRTEGEVHVRNLLLHIAHEEPVMLRAIHSEDLENSEMVEVVAQFVANKRTDKSMEQIVSRLSIESSVNAVSWRIMDNIDNDAD